jgi:hypothetical protein
MASRCVVLHNMFDPAEYVFPCFLIHLSQYSLTHTTGKRVRTGSRN